MDWLTFVAAVIQAIAWPVTVLVIVLLLREPIAKLIPALQRLRYRDLEIDFGQRVQEVASEARRAFPTSPVDGDELGRMRRHLAEVAPLSPRAVVLEAWLELEESAIDATKRRGLNLPSRELRAPILLGQALAQAGILDAGKQGIFDQLRNLRNAAAHASNLALDEDSALAYADSALRLAEYLRTA